MRIPSIAHQNMKGKVNNSIPAIIIGKTYIISSI